MGTCYLDIWGEKEGDNYISMWRKALLGATVKKLMKFDSKERGKRLKDVVVIFGHGDRMKGKEICPTAANSKGAKSVEEVAGLLNDQLDAQHQWLLVLACEGAGRRKASGEHMDLPTPHDLCFIQHLAQALKGMTDRPNLRIGGYASNVTNPDNVKVPTQKNGLPQVYSKLPPKKLLEGSKDKPLQFVATKKEDPNAWYAEIPALWVNNDGKWCTFDSPKAISRPEIKFVDEG
jgi:hypothetical protein